MRRRGTQWALQARLAEEGIDRFGAGVRGDRSQAGERQMGQPMSDRRGHATHLRLLFRRELLQLLCESALGFEGSDVFERVAQLRELASA
jgi:hypothetical protein